MPDGGESLLLALIGDGDRIPGTQFLFLLLEATLSVDEIDLLEGDFEAVLFHRYEHVVRFVGAAEQAAVGDLLNAVLLLTGDCVDFAAEVEVDLILHHRFPEGGFGPLHREHTGGAERSHRAEDGCVTHHDDVINLVAMIFEDSFKPLELSAGHSGGVARSSGSALPERLPKSPYARTQLAR